MRRVKLLLVGGAVCTFLLLAGCRQESPPDESPPSITEEDEPIRDDEPVVPAAPPSEAAVEARADLLVARLQEAINRGDAEELAVLSAILPEMPDVEAAQIALDDYRRYFGDERVVDFERTGRVKTERHEVGHARLVYELVAESGTRKPVLVYYETGFDTMRVFDEFLRYSSRAHEYAASIADAIRSRDPEALADLLTIDERLYPVPLAEEAIANYAERFDLETLEAVFTGLEPRNRFQFSRPFLFSMRGSRDGSPQSHQARLVTEDGMMRWDDPLIPTRPKA